MAHKKAGGTSRNGRDSKGQRLGVKAGDGQAVSSGTIIGDDYTLFATTAGKVKFEYATKSKKRVRVIPGETAPAEIA